MAIEWYSCEYCGKTVRSDNGAPIAHGCSHPSSNHEWWKLGEVGDITFRCSKCGLEIQTETDPYSNGCTQGGYHDWWKQ